MGVSLRQALSPRAAWLAVGLVVFGGHAASGAFVEQVVTFAEQELDISKSGAYDVVTLANCDVTRDVGMPQLPVLPLTVAIPAGARPTRLEVLAAESKDIIGRFAPLPAQRPQILPTPAVEPPPWRFTEPDASVYGRSRPFPEAVAELTSLGHLPGNEAVGVSVHPVQYLPDSGRLRLFTRIALRLHYDAPEGERRPARGAACLERAARELVANGAHVGHPIVRDRVGDSRLDTGDFEYVVVTSEDLASAFDPLVEWKTRKGVPATTVTVEWIDAAYPGADTQERIRAFIADARDAWGALFVLLGGDTRSVPARRAYAMTCEAGGHPDEDAIGCDLYYSDLDGTWDADGDGVYGEMSDAVDLYPDVFVGRAPVTGVTQAARFVAKVLTYERTPPQDYGTDMLMAGEVLWTNPFTDAGIALNYIDRESVPPRFDPITKLYQTLGNESVSTVIEALNDGKSHFLHNGHAWYSVMGCGTGYLERSDADNLRNGADLPLVYSIGCWPAAFDLDDESCIAEHFIAASRGGAVAFIGNSRYGWGAPGNPTYGHSDRFMQVFYGRLFGGGQVNAGVALAVSKASFIPFSQEENVYRWHQYQLNLLGDPEMPIWTAEPSELAVTHPDSLPSGFSELDVVVWDAGGPVEGALVCAMNSTDVYERARTGSDGTAALNFETAATENIALTVTAPDRRPYEALVGVGAGGAHVRVDDVAIDDSEGGNDDGMAGPGETVDVQLLLENSGPTAAGSVSVTVACSDSLIELLTSTADYGDLGPGATAWAQLPLSIRISEDCADGHVARIDVAIDADGVRAAWPAGVGLTVGAPVVVVSAYDVDDARGGDGDGVPEPGEALRMMIEIKNVGLASALAPEILVSSDDPMVGVSGAASVVPDMAPGGTSEATFGITIDPACPSPYFPALSVEARTLDGLVSRDEVVVTVGTAGLSDDLESGAGGWTHGGINDLWTLTDFRTHSGQTSWYCGSPTTRQYVDNMNACLDSPEFVVGVGAELSFWCWYEVPVYHQDGFYVEILSGGSAVDTLDFIGSGGALAPRGSIGNDWLEHRYQVERPAGDTVRVRFRFVSDGADVEEGLYIDDVSVSTEAAPSGSWAPDETAAESPIALHQNRPNPFRLSTNIGFTMAAEGPVTLSVYNVQGRLIRTLIDEPRSAGPYEASWDGRDEFGVDVAAGVYMCRLSFGEHEATRKIILVR